MDVGVKCELLQFTVSPSSWVTSDNSMRPWGVNSDFSFTPTLCSLTRPTRAKFRVHKSDFPVADFSALANLCGCDVWANGVFVFHVTRLHNCKWFCVVMMTVFYCCLAITMKLLRRKKNSLLPSFHTIIKLNRREVVEKLNLCNETIFLWFFNYRQNMRD